MYKLSLNKNTEKGTTQLLLQKRNQQFSTLFRKLRDPVTIMQAYTELHQVYKKYFVDERNSADWVKVLMYLYDNGHLFQTDFERLFGFLPKKTHTLLYQMGARNLIIIDRTRSVNLYSLSADGQLFLKNFTRDSVSAMMKVVRNGRTNKKKIITVFKKKRKARPGLIL